MDAPMVHRLFCQEHQGHRQCGPLGGGDDPAAAGHAAAGAAGAGGDGKSAERA